MSNAMDYAKFFIKRGLDTNPNTYDGNMKLQKLLFFANYISIAERGVPLFAEPIRAFSNGCVVEDVRLRYKNDYDGLRSDSESFEPNFSQDEYDVLNLAAGIFGNLSARELSALNQSFSFWKTAFKRSQQGNGFRNKNHAVVSTDEMSAEIDKIKSVIDRYKANRAERSFREMINGVKFYYSPDFEMTDEIIAQLEEFANDADEDSYSVYIENGNLTIF
jgi:uncharacterized phage-associated protein